MNCENHPTVSQAHATFAYCADLKSEVRLRYSKFTRSAKRHLTRAATNRSKDNKEVVYCKSVEPALGLALLRVDAQAGSNDFQRYGNNVASDYRGNSRACLIRSHSEEAQEHRSAVIR